MDSKEIERQIRMKQKAIETIRLNYRGRALPQNELESIDELSEQIRELNEQLKSPKDEQGQ